MAIPKNWYWHADWALTSPPKKEKGHGMPIFFWCGYIGGVLKWYLGFGIFVRGWDIGIKNREWKMKNENWKRGIRSRKYITFRLGICLVKIDDFFIQLFFGSEWTNWFPEEWFIYCIKIQIDKFRNMEKGLRSLTQR